MRHFVKLLFVPVLTAGLVLSLPSVASAHNDIEFAAHGGYGFTGSHNVDFDGFADPQDGSLSFDPAPIYGALVGYRLEKEGFIYLSYSRQETTAYYRTRGNLDVDSSRGISFDYFQFGGYLESWRGPFAPFMGASIGLNRVAALGGAPGQDFFFGGVLEAGVKLELTHNIHLRLTGRLPITFINGESSAFCTGAAGCISILKADPLVQGQALLGVGFGF